MDKSDIELDPREKSSDSNGKKSLQKNLDLLYQGRFSEKEVVDKSRIWEVLCKHFFQVYVSPNDTVLDLGAGYCDFINNIQCREKLAVDLNDDTPSLAHSNVTVQQASSTDLSFLADQSIDVVFTSNFLEHLRTKEEALQTFNEVHRVLKKGGLFLILQPNIRHVGFEYWDFFDHHIALTDKSLIEGLLIKEFKIKRVISKFLPFTTKSKIPQHPFLVWLYLKIPLVWRIMGKQSFLVAEK
ncbi:MAG: class I SAM-dependent methyltransferase [Nitrospinota bacterium]|nr:class I SAM-dependent methyltransferase [Nitrospinota bacterium]MDH5789504.1 class I SAM-dependent methyltransferase [Nitrospinota bacterium]